MKILRLALAYAIFTAWFCLMLTWFQCGSRDALVYYINATDADSAHVADFDTTRCTVDSTGHLVIHYKYYPAILPHDTGAPYP